MFVSAANHLDHSAPPADTSIAPEDWRILSGFWHPVAFAADVPDDRPLAATLLDVSLAVYRSDEGLVVVRNACPHRGAPLDRGRVADGVLHCPMHGLKFGGSGRCMEIPSAAGRNVAIPRRLDLRTVLHEVRYGLVWVCLSGEPLAPLPDWPAFLRNERNNISLPVDTWHTSAGRHVENFNDVAHFPFVHTQSFGGSPDAPVPPYRVNDGEHELSFSIGYLEPTNRFPDGVPQGPRHVRYDYALTYPFATLLTVDPEGSDFVHSIADVASPVSASRCRIFQIATDTNESPDADLWRQDALTINEEDRPLVEAQEPTWLPLNPEDEGHIPADRFSIAYRRALVRRFGLGSGRTDGGRV